MADIRRVTESFSVAPQLELDDVAGVAAKGFRLLVNNRPDQEVAGQPESEAMAAAAEAAGLDYVHIPVRGAATPEQTEAMHLAVKDAGGSALAFCRSGTRSITTWARGELQAGRPRDELLSLARSAGYDLSASI